MRKAGQCLARATRSYRLCDWHASVESAEEGLSQALPAAASLDVKRLLLNTQGLSLHLLGETEAAHERLTEALKMATAAAAGGGHDAYVDIAGALGDVAANHIARQELSEAEAALKRGLFMLQRAYRPSSVARAVLLQVRGLMYEAQGEYTAAFDSHQDAHATLVATPPAPPLDDRAPSWLQACRSGSTWALLQQGSSAAADALAAADVSGASRLTPLDPREKAFARSLAAITSLSAAATQDGPSGSALAAQMQGAATLRSVVDELTACLGAEHQETCKARENAAMASGGAADEMMMKWRRHWQPALGCGLDAEVKVTWMRQPSMDQSYHHIS